MNLSVARMDQHKGRSNRTQERTEAQTLSTSLGKVPKREAVMTAQIINLADYRKAKEAEQVRKVVNDYFAAHSQIMAWWLSGTPAG
jgi:hypothetical protein